MEWSDGASEGTDVKSTGESGTTKFLRVDGDGTCSWQVPPDTNTQVGGATGVDFHDSTKIRIGAGNDLELHHDGNSYINNTTANQLAVQSDDLKLRSYTDLENYLVATHNGSVDIYHNGVKKLETTSSGVTVTGAVSDSKGDLRSIPKLTKSSQHTLVASDAGKCIMVSSGGIVFPGSTMSSGDAVTIINNSGSDQTITCSAVSTYLAGDTTAKTSITIAGRGMATVWFSDGGTAYISGAGLS